MESVSAIVLAAGESRRFGKSKLLLTVGEKTILETTIDHFLASRAGEVIVVVGYKASEMRKTLAKYPVKIVFNPLYRSGMSTSIARGLEIVNKSASGVLIALADQPLIGSEVIDRLIEEFLDNKRGIVYPTYEGRRGHPVLFSINYRAELLKLQGDMGGREIIDANKNDVLEVAVSSPDIHNDVDTYEDYCSIKSPPK